MRLTTAWFIHSQQKRVYPAFHLICRPQSVPQARHVVVVSNAVSAHHKSFYTFVLIKLIKILEISAGAEGLPLPWWCIHDVNDAKVGRIQIGQCLDNWGLYRFTLIFSFYFKALLVSSRIDLFVIKTRTVS
jgi:hypothetical protein